MERFISAKEYAKIKEKTANVPNEIMESLSSEEQLKLSLAMMYGNKDEIFEVLGTIFDKFEEHETYKEVQEIIKDAIIEQIVTQKDYEETLESISSITNADAEAQAFFTDFMKKIEEKTNFGMTTIKEMSEHLRLVKGLLNETESSFEDLRMYVKNNETLSMSLTSLEENGTRHEFIISLEEDKIYHKSSTLENEVIQDEMYISDKKQEYEIETSNDSISL